MTVIEPPVSVKSHALWEDALALPIGAFLMSWGLYLLVSIDGVTGGLAGVGVVLSHLTGWSFGLIYFVINLPFYFLAARRMGWVFTVKTLIAVALVSVMASMHGLYLSVDAIEPLYAVIFAGLAIGTGMLVLFRHGGSAGGFGILAAYAQARFGIRAGYVQGALDVAVVVASLFLVEPLILLYSVIGAVLLNLVVAINHRPGRYFG